MKLSWVFFFTLCFNALAAQNKICPVVSCFYCKDSLLATEIQHEYKIDFGTFPDTNALVFEYPIKNIGTAPLVICCVKTSSGNIIADWNREPVAPQDTLIIRFQYSAGYIIGGHCRLSTIWGNFNCGEPVPIIVTCQTVEK